MRGLLDESPDGLPVKRANWLKRIAKFTALAGLIVGGSYVSYNCAQTSELEAKYQQVLDKEVIPVAPKTFNTDKSSLYKIMHDPDFANASLAKFSGAITYETESYDNGPNPRDDIRPWVKFFKFHDYLEKTFPVLYKTVKVEKPNKINLLYTWEGSNPDLKPLFLTAHQDVVPVDPLSTGEWSYGPYSGHYDGEFVYGRGTVDCKNLLTGILEGVEQLIKDGFKPERTVIIGFGHDEESTSHGAAAINETLTERYGPDSFYALVDEGSAIMEIDGKYFAQPATGEKGRVDYSFSFTTPGGHSSVPPDHTTIGIAAKLISAFEGDQFEPKLTPDNPFFYFIQEIAKQTEVIPTEYRDAILRAGFDDKANKKALEFIVKDPTFKYLVQTSQAIDIIHGGVKTNALPEFVQFTLNSRVSVDSNVGETHEHILKHVKEIASEFELGLYFNDELLVEPTPKGYIKVTSDSMEPLPVSPAEGPVWDLFAGTIKHVFEDAIFEKGEKIYIAPAIMSGNTDTKRYIELTRNIYRFMAARIGAISGGGVHSINEHIGFKQHLETIAFYYEFIQNADAARD